MIALLTLTGTISDIGLMDDGRLGFTLIAHDGKVIEMAGLTIEQLRSIKELAFDGKTAIQIGEVLA